MALAPNKPALVPSGGDIRAAAAGGAGQALPLFGKPSKSRIELLYSVGVKASSGALSAATGIGDGSFESLVLHPQSIRAHELVISQCL